MVIIVAKKDVFTKTRVKKGLSLNTIAKIANLHYTTINRIENGKTNVSPETAKKVCDALGLEFDELFNITGSSVEEEADLKCAACAK